MDDHVFSSTREATSIRKHVNTEYCTLNATTWSLKAKRRTHFKSAADTDLGLSSVNPSGRLRGAPRDVQLRTCFPPSACLRPPSCVQPLLRPAPLQADNVLNRLPSSVTDISDMSALSCLGLHMSAARSAVTNFQMPAMSPTMTEGGIASWKLKEGDKFAAGDVLLEIVRVCSRPARTHYTHVWLPLFYIGDGQGHD